MMKLDDFGPLSLSQGSHTSPSDGMCIMEMVSYLAGEPWSDTPGCSAPTLSSYSRVINDKAPQYVRDQLQTRVLQLIGTADPDAEVARAEHFAWAAITIFAPYALRAEGSHAAAETLASFDRSAGLPAAARAAKEVAYTANYAADAAAWAAATAATDATAGGLAKEVAYAARAAAYAPGAAAYAAGAAAVAAVWAVAWDDALRVLDEAIALGKHGTSDAPLERLSALKLATLVEP